MNVLSANFGEDLSNAWMKSCLFAFINDTFFAQTLKAFIVYVIVHLIKNPLDANQNTLGFCAKRCGAIMFELLLA